MISEKVNRVANNPYAGTEFEGSYQQGFDEGFARPIDKIDAPFALEANQAIVYSEGVLAGQATSRLTGARKVFTSPRFQNDVELEQCLNTEHRMMGPESNASVKKVQEALMDLGYSIPDGPTEFFGEQTGAAVVAFKTANAIYPNDPVVRPKTMARLDAFFSQGLGALSSTTDPEPSFGVVQVWLNAFIINTIGGLIPRPGHPGELMVHGLPLIGDCFATDDRGFSADITAGARLHAEITLDFSAGTPSMVVNNFCSESFEYDCEDGDLEDHKKGDATRAVWSVPTTVTGSIVSVSLVGAVSNPLVKGSSDIDFSAVVTVDPVLRVVAVDGLVDEFPAFEMYARAGTTGLGKTLLNVAPVSGATPLWNLPGPANIAFASSVHLAP